jgi:hypothetical protein
MWSYSMLNRIWATHDIVTPMRSWTAKTLRNALPIVAAYIGFFILCFVAYARSSNAEPVPAVLVGVPVGTVTAGIVVIVGCIVLFQDGWDHWIEMTIVGSVDRGRCCPFLWNSPVSLHDVNEPAKGELN